MTERAARMIAAKPVDQRIGSDAEFWEVFHYIWEEFKNPLVEYRAVVNPLMVGMQYYLEKYL